MNLSSNLIVNVNGVITFKNGQKGYIIKLDDGRNLFRTEAQFEQDLKNSRITDISAIIGGTVTGDYTFHRAGSSYIADETSTAVKEGKAKVGDTLYRTNDGYRVEGFLTFSRSMPKEVAYQAAQEIAKMLGFNKDSFKLAPVEVAEPAPVEVAETA